MSEKIENRRASSVSVLILALNEAKNLELLLPRLKSELDIIATDYEIIVVDGRSNDDSRIICERNGCSFHIQSKPGYANALREGLHLCSKDCILTIDADNSHPPSYLKEMNRLIYENDIIIASRYCAGGGFEMPRHRVVLSKILNWTTSLLFGIGVSDCSSGYRMYRREIVQSLKSRAEHFDVLIELLLLAKMSGARIKEMPFTYLNRLDGVSKTRLVPFGLAYLRTFFRLKIGV